MNLREAYIERLARALPQIALAIEEQIRGYLAGQPRVDRVAARAKSLDRFLAKAMTPAGEGLKYFNPMHQIQDQIGARIITFYPSDVIEISAIIERYFRSVEARAVVPDSEWEFGYFGKHYILLIPDDVIADGVDRKLVPDFFELQIKTLFQHSWSEANHDLGYKPGANPLSSDDKRRLAYAAAQAWGADRMFDELYREKTRAAASPK